MRDNIIPVKAHTDPRPHLALRAAVQEVPLAGSGQELRHDRGPQLIELGKGGRVVLHHENEWVTVRLQRQDGILRGYPNRLGSASLWEDVCRETLEVRQAISPSFVRSGPHGVAASIDEGADHEGTVWWPCRRDTGRRCQSARGA